MEWNGSLVLCRPARHQLRSPRVEAQLPWWTCGCTASSLPFKSRPPGTRDREAGATTVPPVEVELVACGRRRRLLDAKCNAQAPGARRGGGNQACRGRFRFTRCASRVGVGHHVGAQRRKSTLDPVTSDPISFPSFLPAGMG
jgi:hypothetical protein